jgi:hypothetical protein
MAEHERPEIRDIAWRCPSCENILGYTGSDRRVLRMKYKDFFVFIEEARSIVTLCRRCGKECAIRNTQPLEE